MLVGIKYQVFAAHGKHALGHNYRTYAFQGIVREARAETQIYVNWRQQLLALTGGTVKKRERKRNTAGIG